MSDYTRTQLRNLKKEEKLFASLGFNWLAKLSSKEHEILTKNVNERRIN